MAATVIGQPDIMTCHTDSATTVMMTTMTWGTPDRVTDHIADGHHDMGLARH